MDLLPSKGMPPCRARGGPGLICYPAGGCPSRTDLICGIAIASVKSCRTLRAAEDARDGPHLGL